MGYGKHFESMYTGSMCGKSTDVFAVWGYAIANMRVTKLEAHVELNPHLMAFTFGTTEEKILAAIATLEEPDPRSRSKGHGGRRLVAVTEKTEGPVQYLVVNGYKYRYTPDEQSTREKDRERKRKQRVKARSDDAEKVGTFEQAFGPPPGLGAWEPDGADKVLAIQKPMEKEGL